MKSHQILLVFLSAIRPAVTLLACLVGLLSCAGIDQHEAKQVSVEEQIQLQTLVERGQDALRAGRLGMPSQTQTQIQIQTQTQTQKSVASTGAAEFFYQALAIQPDNPAAQRGLEQILEHYLAQAIDAADLGDFSSSYRLLTQARSIDAGHPSIAPAQAYIATLDDADSRSIVVAGLSTPALNRVIDSLVLEVKPNAAKCRFRIFAPSDPQARALYKALREGYVRNNLGTRIRASTTISKPQRLERICTP